MAGCHYLNQCWLIISEVFRYSPKGNLTGNEWCIYLWYDFENYSFNNIPASPRGQWFNKKCDSDILFITSEVSQTSSICRYLLWFFINTAIVNAQILYRESFLPLTHARSKISNLQFRLQLCTQLIAGYSSRHRSAGGRKRTIDVIHPGNLVGHDLVRVEGRKRVCRNCAQLGRKTPTNRGIETSFMCRACTVPLCRDGCLVEYHDRHTAAAPIEE